ncbi:MAG: hypothetical protein ACR2QC_05300 [Gammaproteobacteria bacterium]
MQPLKQMKRLAGIAAKIAAGAACVFGGAASAEDFDSIAECEKSPYCRLNEEIGDQIRQTPPPESAEEFSREPGESLYKNKKSEHLYEPKNSVLDYIDSLLTER